jgi:hypothetical protein
MVEHVVYAKCWTIAYYLNMKDIEPVKTGSKGVSDLATNMY